MESSYDINVILWWTAVVITKNKLQNEIRFFFTWLYIFIVKTLFINMSLDLSLFTFCEKTRSLPGLVYPWCLAAGINSAALSPSAFSSVCQAIGREACHPSLSLRTRVLNSCKRFALKHGWWTFLWRFYTIAIVLVVKKDPKTRVSSKLSCWTPRKGRRMLIFFQKPLKKSFCGCHWPEWMLSVCQFEENLKLAWKSFTSKSRKTIDHIRSVLEAAELTRVYLNNIHTRASI